MAEYANNINEYIRVNLDSLKISNIELANLLGVSPTMVVYWRNDDLNPNNNRKPNLKKISILAQLFGVSIQDFYELKYSNNINKSSSYSYVDFYNDHNINKDLKISLMNEEVKNNIYDSFTVLMKKYYDIVKKAISNQNYNYDELVKLDKLLEPNIVELKSFYILEPENDKFNLNCKSYSYDISELTGAKQGETLNGINVNNYIIGEFISPELFDDVIYYHFYAKDSSIYVKDNNGVRAKITIVEFNLDPNKKADDKSYFDISIYLINKLNKIGEKYKYYLNLLDYINFRQSNEIENGIYDDYDSQNEQAKKYLDCCSKARINFIFSKKVNSLIDGFQVSTNELYDLVKREARYINLDKTKWNESETTLQAYSLVCEAVHDKKKFVKKKGV